MTRESAQASVRFRIVFTAEEIATLCDAMDGHYDAACRVFKPLHQLRKWEENGMPLDISLDWHDLDILSKICESPRVAPSVAVAIWAQFAALRQVTEVASAAVAKEFPSLVL